MVAGLAAERFLILPHPEVGTFWAQKAADPDRWLAGVRRLVDRGRGVRTWPGVQDRVALVTGAAQGIGAAVARRLAAGGAKVGVLDLAAGRRAGGGRRDHRRRRRGDRPRRRRLASATRCRPRSTGSSASSAALHILVNNAGVLRDNLLFKMTDDDWTMVMEVHLRGAFLCSQIAQKHMVEAKYGRIVSHVVDVRARQPRPGQLLDRQGRPAGPDQDARHRARPVRRHRQRHRARVHRDGDDQGDRRADRHHDRGRCARRPPRRSRCAAAGVPDDIANAVAFFAGEESGYVTGQVLYVDGGRGLL